jgi:hypothetical protein
VARERGAAGGRPTLSEGMLVDARIVARVLGLKLLTVDASVALLPASANGRSPAGHEVSRGYRRRELRGARGTLGDAVRRLDEGRQVLDRAQRSRQIVQRGDATVTTPIRSSS